MKNPKQKLGIYDMVRNRSLLCVNRNLLTVLAETLKLYLSAYCCENSIIRTDTHTNAGMDMRTSLANQDISSLNELSVGTLHAQSLGLGITAVLCRTNTLFMSEELHTDLKHTYTSE